MLSSTGSATLKKHNTVATNALESISLSKCSNEQAYEIAKELLDRGADAKNSDGLTPLHEAIMCNDTRICRFLIANGADSKIKLPNGVTAKDYAKINQCDKSMIELLLSVNPTKSRDNSWLDASNKIQSKSSQKPLGLKLEI